MNFRFLFFNVTLIASYILFPGCGAYNQIRQRDQQQVSAITSRLRQAAQQYHYFMQQVPADRLPKSLDSAGRLTTSGSEWWCSGFYPGTLLYLSEATNDALLKEEALRRLKLLEKEQYNKNTHDLGFMMFCSFGNAYRLNPSPAYRAILVNSARSLASRFNPTVGSIRSWNSRASDFLVIVDNMMNLELLFWASKETGDSALYQIAVTHADNTILHHYRPDHSSYHLVNYDPDTGVPRQKRTVQGAADESAWARGQAWGLYGFTVLYRETGDEKYLLQATRIANFLLNHSNLPGDKIPYWDLNAPGIPNTLRDASAGAIIASALIELAGYTKGHVTRVYKETAAAILHTLSTPAYTAPLGANGGFILKHSVGNLPAKTEVDVPLTYADYYYVEALMRYQKAFGEK